MMEDPMADAGIAAEAMEENEKRAEEISIALSTIKINELTEKQRRAIAGAFAQSLCGCYSHEMFVFSQGFLSNLCREKLGLPLETTLALLPLMGLPPAYHAKNSKVDISLADGSDWKDSTFYHNPLEQRGALFTSTDEAKSAANGGIGEASGPVFTHVSPFLQQISPDPDVRFKILLSLLVIYISDGCYDARVRQIFKQSCVIWGVEWCKAAPFEDAFVQHLRTSLDAAGVSQASRHHAQAKNSTRRWLLISLAAVAGAGLLVASGGIAAPALLSGFTLLGGSIGLGTAATAMAAFFSTAGGAALMLTLFGVTGGGLASYRMARRTAGLSTFRFEQLNAEISTASSPSAEQTGTRAESGLMPWFAGLAGRKKVSPAPPAAVPPPEPAPLELTAMNEKQLVDAGRQAAAKFKGGLHTFIVCSGMLVTDETLPPNDTNADFVVPWGGYEQHLHMHESADVKTEAAPEFPASNYRVSCKGRYCLLRPCMPAEVDYLKDCDLSAGYTPREPLRKTEQVFIILVPVASGSAPGAPDLQFIDVGYVGYSVIGATDEPLRDGPCVTLHIVIRDEKYRGRGIGSDALMTLLLHLAVHAHPKQYRFNPPAANTRAISCAEKVGFSLDRIVEGPEGRQASMTATADSIRNALLQLCAKTAKSPAETPEVDHSVCCVSCGLSGGRHKDTCAADQVNQKTALAFYADSAQFMGAHPTQAATDIEVLFSNHEEGGGSEVTALESRAADGTTLPGGTTFSVAIPTISLPTTTSIQAGITSTLNLTRRVGVYGVGELISRPGWLQRYIPYGDKFTLIFDPDQLLTVGNITTKFVQQYLTNQAVSTILTRTVVATLLAAWTIPSYAISAFSFIDSPWLLALDRADKAGELLADILLRGVHGHRPVSLIGYGIGARVIFTALKKIAAAAQHDRERACRFPETVGSGEETYLTRLQSRQQSPPNPLGIVNDVVLLGAAVNASNEEWRSIRSAVSGRLVNCYDRRDFVLRYVYRAYEFAWNIAGLAPVGSSTSTATPSATSPDKPASPPSKADDITDSAAAVSAHIAESIMDATQLLGAGASAPTGSTAAVLPVVWFEGIENVDVTDAVAGHVDYRNKLEQVMSLIGLEH